MFIVPALSIRVQLRRSGRREEFGLNGQRPSIESSSSNEAIAFAAR
jgi:hypothetical protein